MVKRQTFLMNDIMFYQDIIWSIDFGVFLFIVLRWGSNRNGMNAVPCFGGWLTWSVVYSLVKLKSSAMVMLISSKIDPTCTKQLNPDPAGGSSLSQRSQLNWVNYPTHPITCSENSVFTPTGHPPSHTSTLRYPSLTDRAWAVVG